jgi:hypothetical protein
MVSWLTRIMGSPGNSIRNRAEICCGDHQSASQLLTRSVSGDGPASGSWAAWPAVGHTVRSPRPVLGPAAACGDFPRHRGGRLPQPDGDRGEGLSGMHPEGDLLPVGQRQPPRVLAPSGPGCRCAAVRCSAIACVAVWTSPSGELAAADTMDTSLPDAAAASRSHSGPRAWEALCGRPSPACSSPRTRASRRCRRSSAMRPPSSRRHLWAPGPSEMDTLAERLQLVRDAAVARPGRNRGPADKRLGETRADDRDSWQRLSGLAPGAISRSRSRGDLPGGAASWYWMRQPE